ncbi:hypothetical protein DERF_003135 [Dermatophagoides farinae]|uniref:Uncharacterized protein n=1 Tax=Dermatophagoides farinae TaxID=6954 RepID=A0A922IGF3_DERFA|nr:hypothetical protein DERF_003135 [Dermatophagoides farinae]
MLIYLRVDDSLPWNEFSYPGKYHRRANKQANQNVKNLRLQWQYYDKGYNHIFFLMNFNIEFYFKFFFIPIGNISKHFLLFNIQLLYSMKLHNQLLILLHEMIQKIKNQNREKIWLTDLCACELYLLFLFYKNFHFISSDYNFDFFFTHENGEIELELY